MRNGFVSDLDDAEPMRHIRGSLSAVNGDGSCRHAATFSDAHLAAMDSVLSRITVLLNSLTAATSGLLGVTSSYPESVIASALVPTSTHSCDENALDAAFAEEDDVSVSELLGCGRQDTIRLTSGPVITPNAGRLSVSLLNEGAHPVRARVRVFDLSTTPKTVLMAGGVRFARTVTIPAHSLHTVQFDAALPTQQPLQAETLSGEPLYPCLRLSGIPGRSPVTLLYAAEFMQV